MVPSGTVHAHELSGASGSGAGNKGFPQGIAWASCVSTVGLFHSCNNLGETVSSALTSLAKSLWLLAMERHKVTLQGCPTQQQTTIQIGCLPGKCSRRSV